jgi:hypothetical protein
LIEDQKSAGTGGQSLSSGAWRTRELTTEVEDLGAHASLASNQITLAAGTYSFAISVPAFRVDNHQARLYNITAAAEVKLGTSEHSSSTTGSVTRSIIRGTVTIEGTSVFEVQHQVFSSYGSQAGGVAASWSTEIYTQAEFWKIG